LEGGPPGFPQGFSCLVVLWILLCLLIFAYATVTLSGPGFPSGHSADRPVTSAVLTPAYPKVCRFGLLRVRSPLLAESRLISFPGATEMFQFTPSPSHPLCIHGCVTGHLPRPGFPIRTSAGLWICAPYRSFSQLVTSFFGYRCPGIHPALFVT
jgi:hypothetical protein